MIEIEKKDIERGFKELNNIENRDILIRERGKPFAIVLDYKHYLQMTTIQDISQDSKIDKLQKLKGSLSLKELQRV
jgi:hypothetical protein